MVDTTMDGLAWVRKQVEQADTDLLREMVKLFCERVMSEEADAICGAPYGERSDERTNRRNGYRSRPWDSWTGTIDLAVPKPREGSYFPDWLLEPRRVPYVVRDLRVRFSDEPTEAALAFHRVRGGVSPSHHPTPELSAAFPVAGRTAVRMFCEFERRPVGRAIEAGAHRLLVEGLTDKAGGWQELGAFDLNVSTNAEVGMASQFISYPNRD